MADIKFETGLKTFDINGTVQATFAPTDMAFIERAYKALENMDAMQTKYKDIIEKTNGSALFDLARQMDGEARAEINNVFGFDVCSPLFGPMNVFTIADGFPVWANFLLAVIDQFEGAFAAEKKKTNPRIAKYTAKYKGNR